MKRKDLPTQERLLALFHYDPDTGVFTASENRGRGTGRWKKGRPCGCRTSHGYTQIVVDLRTYMAHRLAWVYMTGRPPENGIDHVNGDRSDNRWRNLREANQSENSGNKRGHRSTKTGIKGVYPFKGGPRFQARVMKNGKNVFTKVFNTIEEAKAAYDAVAKVVHGDFFRSD